MSVDNNLLAQFKKTIGDFDSDASLNDYYTNFLNMAISDLSTDDISDEVLNGELGRACIILFAEALMNKQDIATIPTITTLRNKLATMTKGDRTIPNNNGGEVSEN